MISHHTVVDITLLSACLSSQSSGRFDVEKNQVQEELQKERNLREKLARERDMMTGEMFTIRQQLQVRTKIEKCVSLSLVSLSKSLNFCNHFMASCFG